jgi:anti-anti-sigma regulatory factor
LVLTGISPTVRRVLDLTGTTDLIPIAYTRTVARTTADSLNTDAAKQNWYQPTP